MYFCTLRINNQQVIKSILQFIEQGFQILLMPEKHWGRISAEKNEEQGVFTRSFLPGLIMVFVAVILGDFLFSKSTGFVLIDALIKAFRVSLLVLMTFLASTMVLYEISRWQKIHLGFDASKRIIVYAMFAMFLALVISGVFPFMYFVNVFSFYSLYLIYVAVKKITGTNFNAKPLFFIALFTAIIAVHLLLALLLSILTALIVY